MGGHLGWQPVRLWGVFVTGLFAGGASCAAVQGGLLVGSVVRGDGGGPAGPRRPLHSAPRKRGRGKHARKNQQRARARFDRAAAARRAQLTARDRRLFSGEDAVPVAAFLAGKLASHTLLGALLGLFGASVQISSRTRATMQIAAGVLMVLMAANLLGVSGLRMLMPSPPPAVARLVRRSARSEAAFAPAVLGFLTVLIPCGVTLSVMFLAIASGSALWGAAAMAVFILGTSPLFATLGYALHRSARAFRGAVAKLAAAAVLVAGLYAVNTGLVLRGSSVTIGSLLSAVTGGDAPAAAATAAIGPDGVQQLVVAAHNRSFSPGRLQARAGVPSVLTLQTRGTTGCTRAFVIPSMNIQRILPETGETKVDLGKLRPGELRYTCSMGMYRGVIAVK